MNPQQENRIVVNARFLTRRITGLERYAIEMSRHMKKIQPSLTFIAPDDILHHSIAEELGVTVCGKFKGHLWEQMELPFFLRRKKNPPLINLMNTGPLAYRNQLTVIHDLAFLRNPKWFSKRAARWFTFLVPRVIQASSIIVTDCAFTKKEIGELLNVPSGKIHVLYPGLSELFRSMGHGRKKKDPGAVILTVSTLDPRKNLEHLLEGFKFMGRQDVKLVIVGGMNSLVFGGGGNWKDAGGNPAIVFMGYIPDAQLAELYRQADVFATVSLYEGFGFPPLEALAGGCKVLASDIPTHHEILGDCVTYADPLDSMDIARKLNALLAPGNTIDYSEIEKTLSKFSWSQAAHQLLTIADTSLQDI